MLQKRIISSTVLIGIIICSFLVEWVFALAMLVLTAIGLYEFYSMAEKKGINVYKYFGIGMGLIIPLSILMRFELTKKWELLFILLSFLFLIMMQFRRRRNAGVLADISVTLFGIFYVSWLFSFLIKLKYLGGGMGFLATALIITKLGDIGAYLVGMRFGKTPLIPRISPKKSVEGAVGGFIFSIAGGVACRPFFGPDASYLTIVFVSAAMGILGQLGDLSESLFKRDCNIKDSGSLLPGLGGVLDSIDSLLFSAPVFYFYLTVIAEGIKECLRGIL